VKAKGKHIKAERNLKGFPVLSQKEGRQEIQEVNFDDINIDLSFLDNLPPLELPEYQEICFAETCTCLKCERKRKRKGKRAV